MTTRTPFEKIKIHELRVHINKLFCIYGEDPAYFDEYMDFVLQSDLDKALICFRDLIDQAKKIYPKEWENEHREAAAKQSTFVSRPSKQFRSVYARTKGKVL